MLVVMNIINVDNYDEFAERIAKAGGKKYTEKGMSLNWELQDLSLIQREINLQ